MIHQCGKWEIHRLRGINHCAVLPGQSDLVKCQYIPHNVPNQSSPLPSPDQQHEHRVRDEGSPSESWPMKGELSGDVLLERWRVDESHYSCVQQTGNWTVPHAFRGQNGTICVRDLTQMGRRLVGRWKCHRIYWSKDLFCYYFLVPWREARIWWFDDNTVPM